LESIWQRLGDYDLDNQFTDSDIDELTDGIARGTRRANYDVNHDGVVDLEDRTAWVKEVANTYFGDANLDGEFNSTDLVNVFAAGQYEDEIALNSTWATGDWNGDGEFDSSDLVKAFQDGGYEIGPQLAVPVVPEPSGGLWLMLLALIVVMRGRSAQETEAHRRPQHTGGRGARESEATAEPRVRQTPYSVLSTFRRWQHHSLPLQGNSF
ncbi:MAG: hypothetical protein KDA87_27465, partial [Planctomycetales bacterium]|nr:hypothetical protein [Planctomycetales bacterium]